jgi:hypothetical protein
VCGNDLGIVRKKGVSMKLIKKLLGIAAITAVIGFMLLPLTGCPAESDDGNGVTTVPVTGVSLNQKSISLTVGGTATLTATVAPDNATNKAVSWTSSDPASATVSNGVVTAVAEGTTIITVTTADGGRKDTCTVTVTDGSGDIGGKTPITVAEISIVAPVNGGTPATTVSSKSERFTAGTVTWSPNDDPFKPNEEYTATVTLTANSDYTFTGLNANNATINNSIATITSNTGETLTLTHKFPKTSTKIVTSIAIKSQPTKMTYSHGEELDLSGMVVTLTYNDETTKDVTPIDFAVNGITPTPAQDAHLEHNEYNNKPIKIEYGNLSPIYTTVNLTVAAVNIDVLTFEPNEIPAETYTGDYIKPAITVKHTVVDSERTLTEGTDYTLEYSNNRDAGTATITITCKGDYTGIRTVNFTINKAAGAAVNAPTLKSMSDVVGNSGYSYNQGSATINAVTINNGQSVEYGISTTNNAADVTVWQDGLTFSDLIVGFVDYQFIFARSKGDDNHLVGAASAGLPVTIPYVQRVGIDFTNSWWDGFSSLPDNAPNDPYTIKMILLNIGSPSSVRTLRMAIQDSKKYINLDLSDSTFTRFENDFRDCTYLTGIILPASLDGSITGSITQDTFRGCTSLTSITINGGSIGDLAFYNVSTSLSSVTIGSGVTSIGNGAFDGCTNLASVTIESGVTSIGAVVFRNCSSLTNITIPNSVTSIGTLAFSGCTNLTIITFATGSNIPDANFGNNVSPEGSTGAGGNTLKTAYNTGKAGSYTRAANGSTWSKQP